MHGASACKRGANRRTSSAVLSRFRSGQHRKGAKPVSTDGRTIYAVGDVHGRLDLLDPLLDQIRDDAFAKSQANPPVLIFVGDYVDRGAWSKGVIDCLIALQREAAFEVRTLKGNHEEALLDFLGDANVGPAWCDQ